MSSATTTTDHDAIRNWVEKRGGDGNGVAFLRDEEGSSRFNRFVAKESAER